ncbi:acetate/propionate family kinase [Labilithrix luteola]|nr:acetate/propionate family kinase [Labilithrix luteola]
MSSVEERVLCVNSGSSSLKFALFASYGERLDTLATLAVQNIGGARGRVVLRSNRGGRELEANHLDHAQAFETAFSLLEEAQAGPFSIVGHRIVHGGPRYVEPALVDPTLVANLRAIVPLAPLHLPSSIAGIEAVARRYPAVPQVACFDTAFHSSMPEVARRLPLTDGIDGAGVRRYGFHGLSYEYVMSTFGPTAPRRVVIAHLGNGASLVAVENGKSVDTTMGFTPAGGVMMGTRPGDLDPGVLLHLLRQEKLSPDALAQVIEREAGLVGVGGTSDMKELLARSRSDERAKLAIAMFCRSVRKAIAGLASILGGIDVLVFTGGIGEHAAEVREGVCDGLSFMGIELDRAKNDRAEDVVSTSTSRCVVRVVRTDEDAMIAKHSLRIARANR